MSSLFVRDMSTFLPIFSISLFSKPTTDPVTKERYLSLFSLCILGVNLSFDFVFDRTPAPQKSNTYQQTVTEDPSSNESQSDNPK